MFKPPLALAVAAACLLGVAGLAVEAVRFPYFAWDPPLALAVQSVPVGPLDKVVLFYSWLLGVRQVALAAAGVLLVFLFNRWGAVLMAAGAVSAAVYTALDLLVHRPRPDPHLIHVLAATPSNSFPSGHVVFFTWFSVLLMVTLGRRLPRPWQAAGWVLAAAVIAATAFSRVWAGAHWPSDVLGGFLLGAGWTLLVLVAAGRFLPRSLYGEEVRTPSRSHSR